MALVFFSGKGYIILKQNWRFGHKEVDMVMSDGDWLVFAEVKTRRGYGFGYPEEAVNEQKQAFMKAAAQAWYESFGGSDKIRFDVLSIVLGKNDEVMEMLHLADAF